MSRKGPHDGKQPPVRDTNGRRYSKTERGGWVPDDDPDARPVTWSALQQQVPNNGELHVDHGAPDTPQLTWKSLRNGGSE